MDSLRSSNYKYSKTVTQKWNDAGAPLRPAPAPFALNG